jgi:hypothetical protein
MQRLVSRICLVVDKYANDDGVEKTHPQAVTPQLKKTFQAKSRRVKYLMPLCFRSNNKVYYRHSYADWNVEIVALFPGQRMLRICGLAIRGRLRLILRVEMFDA